MSYDRSPRAVCSTTIGTKFNALVSNLRAPRSTGALGAHEILERHALRRAPRAREQKVHDLVLENRSLDLSHHATIAAVELRGLVGLFVRGRELLDALLETRFVELDLVLAQKLLNQ